MSRTLGADGFLKQATLNDRIKQMSTNSVAAGSQAPYGNYFTNQPMTPPPNYVLEQPRMDSTAKGQNYPTKLDTNDINSENVTTSASNTPKRWMLLKDCSENVGIPGIPNFFKAHNLCLKLFWLIANIICWGLFAYVLRSLTIKYIAYPTSVNVDIQVGTNMEFPAVTVCNLNRVQANRIDKDSHFYGLTQLSRQVVFNVKKKATLKFDSYDFKVPTTSCDKDGLDATEFLCTDESNCILLSRKCDGVDDCDDSSDEQGCPVTIPTGDTTEEETTNKQEVGDKKGIQNADMYEQIDWTNPDWYDVYSYSKTEDFRDIYPFTYMNQSEVDQWSNSADDFIFTCSFDQSDCGVKSDLYEFLHERYGKCVTFNSPMINRTSKLSTFSGDDENVDLETTTRTGVLYGLKLGIWLDVEEYISLLSPSAGAIVSVHNPRFEPDLDTTSVVIEPGNYALISVKRFNINRLPSPYSDCATAYPEHYPIPDEKRNTYDYNQQICLNYCQQNAIFEACECYESYMTGAEVLCDHTNVTITECVYLVYDQIANSEIQCDCPMACKDDFYETRVSSSEWPLASYVPFMIDYAWKNVPDDAPFRKWVDSVLEENQMNFDDIAAEFKKEMLRISVHFETMSFETIDFYASYTEVQFVADIGGYMGLFVGVCMMTMFEMIDWLFRLSCCTGE